MLNSRALHSGSIPAYGNQLGIPPAAHTYQGEVETVHRLEEDEFFGLEDFSNRGEFLAKVHTYQIYFNLARPNSHKENLSPWQIIERLAPARRSNSACFRPSSSLPQGDAMWVGFPISQHANSDYRAGAISNWSPTFVPE
jgi:hypothetical protein